MVVFDAQVHAYEADRPSRPWTAALPGPAQVTGEDMVRAMDAAGVDAALLTSPYTVYRFDYSYAVEVAEQFPDRFALVAPFDSQRSDIADAISNWAAIPGVAGVRLMGDVIYEVGNFGMRQMMAAVADRNLPVCLHSARRLPEVAAVAAAFGDVQFVIDHLGMKQALSPQDNPFADLPALLALARHPNVAVKVTGVATLSREPYPFADMWPPLLRVIAAFGIDRCLWGTDWTRVLHLTYPDMVRAFAETDQLGVADKAALMGGSLQKIFGLEFTARQGVTGDTGSQTRQ
jgi:predicted TIM-barrel fold metal-dependent hydrolase